VRACASARERETVSLCVRVRARVYVCARERERERVCVRKFVCVCVCDTDRHHSRRLRGRAHRPTSRSIRPVGCTVVNALSGKLPWQDEDNKFAAMFKAAHGQAPPFDTTNVSEPFKQLLAACFEPDSSLRPAPSTLLAHPSSAEHPWATSCRDERRDWGLSGFVHVEPRS